MKGIDVPQAERPKSEVIAPQFRAKLWTEDGEACERVFVFAIRLGRRQIASVCPTRQGERFYVPNSRLSSFEAVV